MASQAMAGARVACMPASASPEIVIHLKGEILIVARGLERALAIQTAQFASAGAGHHQPGPVASLPSFVPAFYRTKLPARFPKSRRQEGPAMPTARMALSAPVV